MISSSLGSAVLSGVEPYDDAAKQTRLIGAARLQRLEQAGERVEELQALHVAAEIVDQRLRDVEQRRDGCCTQNMLSANRQRAGTHDHQLGDRDVDTGGARRRCCRRGCRRSGRAQQRKVHKHTHCSKLRRKRRLTLGG